jgi:DNA-binding MarR family transcriptional regulator
MLRVVWQWVREEIYTGVVAAGFDDLNPAHVGLFRYPTIDGRRPSELADEVNITRQSVNDLLGHLDQSGYITREPDPGDGRARIIRLTEKGRAFETVCNGLARAAESNIAELLGPQRFAELRTSLDDLTRHVTERSDGHTIDRPASG